MSSSNVIRYGGLAAIIGGVLILISDLLTFTVFSGDIVEVATSSAYLVDGSMRVLAGILLLIGLVGLYARQVEASGALGLAGFLVAFAGTALVLGTWWTNAFTASSLARKVPEFLEAGPTGVLSAAYTLSFVIVGLGWLLFGAASFRAGVYPRAATVVLMAGAALSLAPLPASGVVLIVAVIWLGLTLFSQREAAVRQPGRMTPSERPVH